MNPAFPELGMIPSVESLPSMSMAERTSTETTSSAESRFLSKTDSMVDGLAVKSYEVIIQHVSTLRGSSTVNVTVNHAMSGLDLKDLLCDRLVVPPECQLLFYRGNSLGDTDQIGNHITQSGQTIQMRDTKAKLGEEDNSITSERDSYDYSEQRDTSTSIYSTSVHINGEACWESWTVPQPLSSVTSATGLSPFDIMNTRSFDSLPESEELWQGRHTWRPDGRQATNRACGQCDFSPARPVLRHNSNRPLFKVAKQSRQNQNS
jgi:hypothetical protein